MANAVTLCWGTDPCLMTFLFKNVTATYINQLEPIQTSSIFFTSSTESLLDWPKSKSDLFQSQQCLDTNCTTHVGLTSFLWPFTCGGNLSWPSYKKLNTYSGDKPSTRILLRSVKASTGNTFVSQSHRIDWSWTHSQDLQRSLKHCLQIALKSSWSSWMLTLPFLEEAPFSWGL